MAQSGLLESHIIKLLAKKKKKQQTEHDESDGCRGDMGKLL